MKLSFKKRRLLVQALYAFRAHTNNYQLSCDACVENIKNIKDDITRILIDTFIIGHYSQKYILCIDGYNIKDRPIVDDNSDIVQVSQNIFLYTKDHLLIVELSSILYDVICKNDELDKIISYYLKNNWNWSRVASIVKMILRIGTYEILFIEKERGAGVIRHYLEIAKNFNHCDDIKFINAVLDAILKKYITHSERSLQIE